MKVVSKQLGHSSLAITADTYTSVVPSVAQAAAEAVADLVPPAVADDLHAGSFTFRSHPTPKEPKLISESGVSDAYCRSGWVGPVGIEPTTRGLKGRTAPCQAVTGRPSNERLRRSEPVWRSGQCKHV